MIHRLHIQYVHLALEYAAKAQVMGSKYFHQVRSCSDHCNLVVAATTVLVRTCCRQEHKEIRNTIDKASQRTENPFVHPSQQCTQLRHGLYSIPRCHFEGVEQVQGRVQEGVVQGVVEDLVEELVRNNYPLQDRSCFGQRNWLAETATAEVRTCCRLEHKEIRNTTGMGSQRKVSPFGHPSRQYTQLRHVKCGTPRCHFEGAQQVQDQGQEEVAQEVDGNYPHRDHSCFGQHNSVVEAPMPQVHTCCHPERTAPHNTIGKGNTPELSTTGRQPKRHKNLQCV